MEKKVIQKNLIRDCLPTVFSLMLSGLYSVMDGLFVGRAAGDTGLAAVNLAWPLVAVITATGIGIGSGGSVLFSNLAGKDEKEESEKTYHLTVCLLVGVGILLSVILFLTYPILLQLLGARGEVLMQAEAYVQIIILGCVFQIIGSGMIPLLRNRGMAVSAMVSMVTGMFVNLALNYVFIFKVGLGIRGAALGTIAAQISVIFICIYLIYIKGKTKVQRFGTGKEV
ncbi:MAG: MATE family efflux transporter [[Clostridium] nexile]